MSLRGRARRAVCCVGSARTGRSAQRPRRIGRGRRGSRTAPARGTDLVLCALLAAHLALLLPMHSGGSLIHCWPAETGPCTFAVWMFASQLFCVCVFLSILWVLFLLAGWLLATQTPVYVCRQSLVQLSVCFNEILFIILILPCDYWDEIGAYRIKSFCETVQRLARTYRLAY